MPASMGSQEPNKQNLTPTHNLSHGYWTNISLFLPPSHFCLCVPFYHGLAHLN